MHWGATGLVAATVVACAVTHIGLYGTVYRRRILAPVRFDTQVTQGSGGGTAR
jgi:hypothetical protein